MGKIMLQSGVSVRCLLLAALASASGWGSALADTAEGEQPASLFGTQTDLSVGLGAGIDQKYMGSKASRPLVMPTLSAHRGAFFADFTRGLGLEWQSTSGFYVGQAFGYDLGRVTHNDELLPGSAKLSGLGDVPITATSTLTLAQQLNPRLLISADLELGLDGHERGNRYRIGLESELFKSDADSLTLDLDTHLGDARYNQTYFGVTAVQSLDSHFARFQTDPGIYAYSLSASYNHSFDSHLSALLQVSGTRYAGKLAASPIVESDTSVTALLSLIYAY